MTKEPKNDPLLALDIPFEDALKRFAQTDPDELEEALESDEGIELPKATHQGEMRVHNLILDCYVLEDGRRVFHKRGMAKALGLKSEGGNAFMKTMSGKGIGSSLPDTLQERIQSPINFKPLTQDIAHGYEADVLVDVAKAIVEADRQQKLNSQQKNLVAQAQILINAFAKVGVVALIDEATGYQQIRDPHALRYLVEQYIAAERQQWDKQFPDEFYDDLNRLYGSKKLTQRANGLVVQNRPQHFAKFTRTYVYHPLENGEVLKELDAKNPRINGTRRDRLHQHLTQDYGLIKLKRQVQEVMTLMAVSDNIPQFKRLFSKRFPASGDPIPLFDDI